MRIEYEYFKDKGYLISLPKGIVGLQDVKNYANELLNDSSITQPFIEIANFSDVHEFKFGYSEVEELMESFRKLKELKGYEGACLVVEKDISRGMSNILREVAKESGIVVRTFKTVEDASQYVQLLKT